MLTKLAAGLTVAIGAALVVWILIADVSFTAPLLVSLVGGGVMLIGLGAGIAWKKRAAWAFALVTAGVGIVTLLLAVPAIHRAGSGGTTFAAIALAAVVAQLVLLIAAKDEF